MESCDKTNKELNLPTCQPVAALDEPIVETRAHLSRFLDTDLTTSSVIVMKTKPSHFRLMRLSSFATVFIKLGAMKKDLVWEILLCL